MFCVLCFCFVFFVNSVLNVYSSGRDTGLVIDCGRSTTRISMFFFVHNLGFTISNFFFSVPVYHGCALRKEQREIKIGSTHLVDYLQSLVAQVIFSLLRS